MMFLDSSMVEHTAVNRGVVGSSPTRGAFLIQKNKFYIIKKIQSSFKFKT